MFVFDSLPWVHEPEPAEIQAVFKSFGTKRKIPKGYQFVHGGDVGEVSLVIKGLVFFTFIDSDYKGQVFAVIPPQRVVGDMDALTRFLPKIVAIAKRPSEVLTLPGSVYRREIVSDRRLLQTYCVNALRKTECQSEGFIANYTLPLERRLLVLMHSIINSFYPQKEDDWNPLPLQLTTFEMAEILASSRTSISTIINQWKDAGFAKRERNFLSIHGKLFAEMKKLTEPDAGARFHGSSVRSSKGGGYPPVHGAAEENH